MSDILSFALLLAATAESQKLHLLVVTADGRRVYFSTQYLPSRGSYMPQTYQTFTTDPAKERPVTMQAIFARPALPQVGVSIGRINPAEIHR